MTIRKVFTQNINFVLRSIEMSMKGTVLPLMYAVYSWSKNYEGSSDVEITTN